MRYCPLLRPCTVLRSNDFPATLLAVCGDFIDAPSRLTTAGFLPTGAFLLAVVGIAVMLNVAFDFNNDPSRFLLRGDCDCNLTGVFFMT